MSHRVHTRLPSRDDDHDDIATTTDPDIVAAYLEDAAHYPGGHAAALARPRSESDVAALVRSAGTLLPVGAQSSLTGGATPMGDTLVAMAGLDRLTAIGKTHLTAQAGVPLRVIQEELSRRGAFYPPAPTMVPLPVASSQRMPRVPRRSNTAAPEIGCKD